jgi:hypothetical protein
MAEYDVSLLEVEAEIRRAEEALRVDMLRFGPGDDASRLPVSHKYASRVSACVAGGSFAGGSLRPLLVHYFSSLCHR